MGHDEHNSNEFTTPVIQNKEHIFFIVPDAFPIPEDGIIWLPFLDSYQYVHTNNSLTLDGIIYNSENRNIMLPPHSVNFITFNHPRKSGHAAIYGHPNIDDAIFKISENKIRIPMVNNTSNTTFIPTSSIVTKPIKIEKEEEKIQYISKKEFAARLKLLQENIRVDHIESELREGVEKIIYSHQDLFVLPGDEIPYTDLAVHKIILKDENPINVKCYRPPECHNQEIKKQIGDMLKKNVIKESNSHWNAPIWVVPKKRMLLDSKNGESS